MTRSGALMLADAAGLPARYVEIKRELAALERIDLCKEWGDRAAAIRAYAQMARDPELEALARRVRAWATRRAGELLAEIDEGQGTSAKLADGDDHKFTTKKDAAHAAGLTEI